MTRCWGLLLLSLCAASSSSIATAAKQEGCAVVTDAADRLMVAVDSSLLTAAEAVQLIEKYGRRATADYDPAFGSASTYLRDPADVHAATAPLLRSVGERAARLVATAVDPYPAMAYMEFPVITRYLPGESYGVHGDSAYLNRTHTVLIYLQAPSGGGGETIFPHLEFNSNNNAHTASLAQLCSSSSADVGVLRIKPAVGSAVMWKNLSPSTGLPDRRAFHGSCPVLGSQEGEDGGEGGSVEEAKWVVQFWFDDKPTGVWPEQTP